MSTMIVFLQIDFLLILLSTFILHTLVYPRNLPREAHLSKVEEGQHLARSSPKKQESQINSI